VAFAAPAMGSRAAGAAALWAAALVAPHAAATPGAPPLPDGPAAAAPQPVPKPSSPQGRGPTAAQAPSRSGARAEPEASATLLPQASQTEDGAALPLPLRLGDHALVDPWFLILWPVLLAAALRPRRAAAARGPAGLAAGLPRSLKQRLGWLPRLCELAGLALWIFALARPVATDQVRTDVSEGVDILLVLDRSGSMTHPDLAEGRTRLEVAKAVVEDFARRRMTDTVGASDNVGLLVFARVPELLCPFTLDFAALQGFLSAVQPAPTRAEDGTAIGVALAKGVRVLSRSEAKSRVIVLLTDGLNTDPELEPLDAAELARQRGIRVYTILAGRLLYQAGLFNELVATEEELDSSELEAIAERTGGRFYRARDARQLEQIYGEIEALERTPRREDRAIHLTELYPPFLLGGLLLYVAGFLLAGSWQRRLL
jgi:Ca-activated chloride channel family protein